MKHALVILKRMSNTPLVLVLLFSIGCAYQAPPTAPTVTPPVTVIETPPPVVPAPTPLTLVLSLGRAELYAGEGFSLYATPISGQVMAPATYDWSFGDGTTETTQHPAAGHVYAKSGSFTASVMVRDRDGRTAEASRVVTVTNRPPPPRDPRPPTPSGLEGRMTCTAGDVGENTGCNVRVTYKGKALPPSAIQSVDWEWGDGEDDQNAPPAMNHVYDVAGQYYVWAEITASTSDGTKTTTASEFVNVEP